MGEGNFPHGAMFGECSLLASYAELSPRKTFAAVRGRPDRDVGELFELQHDFQRMRHDLWAQPGPGSHMDGAYDKMLVKLGMLPGLPAPPAVAVPRLHRRRLPRLPRVLDERWRDWVR